MKKYQIVFYGTPEFSVPFLEALIDAPFLDVVAVVTEPDKPAGRGKLMKESAVAQYCNSNLRMYPNVTNKIKLIKPEKISSYKLQVTSYKPDLAVVVAYGQIIPKKILEIPKYGAINVHPSDLPKYRGPAPIQGVLINGDKKTAISVMKMDEKMDHGPILAKKLIDIDIKDDYFSLEKKIIAEGPEFLIKNLRKYLDYCSKNEVMRTKVSSSHIRSNDNISSRSYLNDNDKLFSLRSKNIFQKQDHKKATFTKMIKKEDGLIDWTKSPLEIHNKIRAYSAWPKAYTYLSTPTRCTCGKRLNILKSKLVSGKLVLEVVQLESKKPIKWNVFLNGYKDKLPQIILDKLT